MDRKRIIRQVFSAVMLLAVCLVSPGCRSAGSANGLLGASGLGDPVPPQWEPEVQTLAPADSIAEDEETGSAE